MKKSTIMERIEDAETDRLYAPLRKALEWLGSSTVTRTNSKAKNHDNLTKSQIAKKVWQLTAEDAEQIAENTLIPVGQKLLPIGDPNKVRGKSFAIINISEQEKPPIQRVPNNYGITEIVYEPVLQATSNVLTLSSYVNENKWNNVRNGIITRNEGNERTERNARNRKLSVSSQSSRLSMQKSRRLSIFSKLQSTVSTNLRPKAVESEYGLGSEKSEKAVTPRVPKLLQKKNGGEKYNLFSALDPLINCTKGNISNEIIATKRRYEWQ